MMSNEIDYADVKKLGFKRMEYSDSVHYNKHGWNDFLMELQINKQIYFSWDTITHEVQMIRIDKDRNIKGRFSVESYKQLLNMLIFFGKVDDSEKCYAILA